jgi:YD repeat-containing protein
LNGSTVRTGRRWSLYDDLSHPGFLTRVTLVGTDASERILAAYEHDAEGNVVATWRGAAAPSDPGAVDQWTLAFDDPETPEEAIVTDPLGNLSIYALASRANRNVKPRLVLLSGSCPACGLGPDTQLTYGDAANPYRPTQEIDGKGHVTRFAYDVNGQMTSRIEAFGTALERETSWQYDEPGFPAFATVTERPSTSGNPFDVRRATVTYDAEGNAVDTTIEGVEDGFAFAHTTVTTYNAAGQPTSIDPPGFGTADQTAFTYDPVRGDLLPLTRTDPLIGTTSFDYDAFNRRTSVTDVNGVVTETEYDELDRVRLAIRRGASAPEDLVTEHEYDVFGDLLRTTLPRGNAIEYGYDDAGRLVSIERKPDAATPGERTLYTLDAFGHRTREELQSWDGVDWATAAATEFQYSTRCHLDRVVQAPGTPEEAVTEHAYDCDGNLERTWDPNHPRFPAPPPPPPPPPPAPPDGDGLLFVAKSESAPTELFVYDALDRLVEVRQPWAGEDGGEAVTAYAYDVQDHLVAVTDAEGNATAYSYSDRDLLTEEVSPVAGTTSYVYNERGQLTSETDARGVTVLRTVDELDRVTFVDTPDPTLDTTYVYDDPGASFSLGRLTAIERGDASVDYAYDRFGRVTQDGALTYAYDEPTTRTTTARRWATLAA